MLYALCRILFTLCVAYPATYLWLGVSSRGREALPTQGPAVVVANHNSHLDTLVLLTRFPLRLIPQVRIAAAAQLDNLIMTNVVTLKVGPMTN